MKSRKMQYGVEYLHAGLYRGLYHWSTFLNTMKKRVTQRFLQFEAAITDSLKKLA